MLVHLVLDSLLTAMMHRSLEEETAVDDLLFSLSEVTVTVIHMCCGGNL